MKNNSSILENYKDNRTEFKARNYVTIITFSHAAELL